MKKLSLGIGALVGLLLMAPMTGIMYLADRWLDLPSPLHGPVWPRTFRPVGRCEPTRLINRGFLGRC